MNIKKPFDAKPEDKPRINVVQNNVFDRKIVDASLEQLKDYWSDIWQSTRMSHWVNWAMEQRNRFELLSSLKKEELAKETVDPKAAATREAIIEKMGEISYIGEWLAIDQDRINAFAEATEDKQWIHVSEDRAKSESLFKSTVAHGYLTLSLLPKLTQMTEENNPFYPDCKMIINMGLNSVRFPSPVKSGSRVRAIKKIIDVQTVRRGLIVCEEITIEIENSQRVACIAQPLFRLVF